jgi:hypothetical protein
MLANRSAKIAGARQSVEAAVYGGNSNCAAFEKLRLTHL